MWFVFSLDGEVRIWFNCKEAQRTFFFAGVWGGGDDRPNNVSVLGSVLLKSVMGLGECREKWGEWIETEPLQEVLISYKKKWMV